ncbi:hypothetical protein [Streptomyces sp. CMB-StM0423]|uniref:hypothetical protein n=1 Tax=Streptomyces sp. CMB-StM0423 TaxID=2059884 RepID=UPI000C70B42D|nr:hypothetical protein [Streptomyces sp. CMB-StM0423]AUH43982.1 hypothetical protein CXR04_30760 [Streptomyces sp. CMB-StM0423]
MSRRIRRLSVAGAAVFAVAGLATGASAALDRGDDKPEVRLVVNEDREQTGARSAAHEDCPDKGGSGAPSGAAGNAGDL